MMIPTTSHQLRNQENKEVRSQVEEAKDPEIGGRRSVLKRKTKLKKIMITEKSNSGRIKEKLNQQEDRYKTREGMQKTNMLTTKKGQIDK